MVRTGLPLAPLAAVAIQFGITACTVGSSVRLSGAQQRPRKPTLQPLTLQPGTPFSFGCTAPPSADLLANLTRWMFDTLQPTARATVAWDCALGPFGGDESADVYSQYRTPALFCGTGMRSLTPDAVAVLRKLDAAGVYSSFGLGEWGSEFHCLTPAEDPKADPGCGAWEHGYLHPRSDCGPSGYFNISLDPALSGSINCSRVDCSKLVLGRNPHNSTEAYQYVRTAFTLAAWTAHAGYDGPGGGVHSTPGYSYYTHEPAKWGAKLTGFEVGENIEDAQVHVAFARGGSRQRGVPWHAQLSPWHGAAETSLCPDGAAICHLGSTCQGPDAGHSLTFLRRMFIYHWLAGSALNTAECCSCYGLANSSNGRMPWLQPAGVSQPTWDESPAYWAKPNGEMLRDVFQLYASHDRGTPHIPVAIVIDAYAGYGGSMCSPKHRQQWGTFVHTPQTQSVYDLLNHQLLACEPDCQYPAVDANISLAETMQLRASPLGEFVDVLQSDASAEALALYPTVLLAGEIEWRSHRLGGEDLLVALCGAARLPHSRLRKVLLAPYHVAELGPKGLATLRGAFNCSTAGTGVGDGNDTSCHAVEVLEEWHNPRVSNRLAAISDARLSSLAAELNLVNVSAQPFSIQWTTNVLDNGDVISASLTDPWFLLPR